MTILNKPDMSYGVWAEGGNIEIPSSEKVEQGWIIEKPLNETMNWLQNRSDRMLQYINQRGVPEWDVRTEYPVGAYVARTNKIYQALSVNQDADPTLNLDIWEVAFVSNRDFIDYSGRVDNIEQTEGYLDLYVSKKNPVMTGAAKAPSYNSENNKTGILFTEDVTKVRNGSEVVVEFSGGTNPKDVVTHEQLALAIQVFKVGSIYTTTTNENPSITFGYGTWERFGEGRVLVGFSSSVSNSIPEWAKTAGSKFGEYNHVLTKEELASHNHPIMDGGNISSGRGGQIETGTNTSYLEGSLTVGFEGGDQPHNNVQPSIVVYFWKRVS